MEDQDPGGLDEVETQLCRTTIQALSGRLLFQMVPKSQGYLADSKVNVLDYRP